jgi:hypothetical protein
METFGLSKAGLAQVLLEVQPIELIVHLREDAEQVGEDPREPTPPLGEMHSRRAIPKALARTNPAGAPPLV